MRLPRASVELFCVCTAASDPDMLCRVATPVGKQTASRCRRRTRGSNIEAPRTEVTTRMGPQNIETVSIGFSDEHHAISNAHEYSSPYDFGRSMCLAHTFNSCADYCRESGRKEAPFTLATPAAECSRQMHPTPHRRF